MIPSIYKAILLAVDAHNGQKDKAGVRYINHPARVAASVRHLGEEYEIVGWLHDVIEDSNIVLATIRDVFGSDVAEAVDAISRRNGETYFDYIKRCKANKIAREVKIADLKDNSLPERVSCLPISEQGVIKRYARALNQLEAGK